MNKSKFTEREKEIWNAALEEAKENVRMKSNWMNSGDLSFDDHESVFIRNDNMDDEMITIDMKTINRLKL